MNSKGILYIDCPPQEKEGAFSTEKELSENEYVKMLRDYSKTIGNTKSNSYNGQFNIYEVENKYNEEPQNYAKSSVIIYDMSGKLSNIKELYRLQKNGTCILIIELVKDEMDDAFESEYKFWKRDSMNINNDKMIGKDDRIRFLPIKDLQLEIDDHLFLFSDCKIYHEYEDSKIALIIRNITEI